MSYYRSPENRYDPADPDTHVITGASGLDEFHGYVADCGQAAAEVLLAMQKGHAPSIAEMNSMVQSMISHGEASSQGATSLKALGNECARRGVTTNIVSDWRTCIATWASRRAVVLGLGNAGVLPGENPDVRGHFICVVGFGPRGFICSDPNTLAAKEQKLVYFKQSELDKAQVWGALLPTADAIGGDPTGGGAPPGAGGGGIPNPFPCPAPGWWPSWLPYPGNCNSGGDTGATGGAKDEFGPQRAHDVLQELPGFLGLAAALDDIETVTPFQPPQGLFNTPQVPGYVAGWVIGNTMAIAVRFAVAVLGLVMILILVLAAVRKPVAEALDTASQFTTGQPAPIANGMRNAGPIPGTQAQPPGQQQPAPQPAQPAQQARPGAPANAPARVAPANAPTTPMRVP